MLITKGCGDRTLKRQVYELVLSDILEGKLVPERPFTEKELSEKYRISKSPIREALIELCSEGVLRSIPRYGYEVLRIIEKDVEDAKRARIIIECGALSDCFDTIDQDDVQHLRSIIEDSGDDGLFIHWDRNSRFHLELMKCSGNDALFRMLEIQLRLMRRAYAQFQFSRTRKLRFKGEARSHHIIIDAIESKDKERAVQSLRDDIDSFEIVS